MSYPLNDTQLEILKLFSSEQSEDDLKEIKSLLITYLAEKVTREADKSFDTKGYKDIIFEKWKKEHSVNAHENDNSIKLQCYCNVSYFPLALS
jgi:hypothetical protein